MEHKEGNSYPASWRNPSFPQCPADSTYSNMCTVGMQLLRYNQLGTLFSTRGPSTKTSRRLDQSSEDCRTMLVGVGGAAGE